MYSPHTLSSIRRSESHPDPSSQFIQFLVLTTIIKRQAVGTRIREPDTVVKTNNDSFDSRVTFNAKPPISYMYAKHVRLEHEKIESGHTKIVFITTFQCWIFVGARGQLDYCLNPKDGLFFS